MQKLSPNKTIIKKHLEFLFSNMNDYEDGSIEISILNQSKIFEYTEIDKAVEAVIEWNTQGKNVYTVGSLLLPDLPPFGRSTDEEFYATKSIWCDIDDDINPDRLKELYKNCPPNGAVITGSVPYRRVHLWWKLDECITDSEVLVEALRGVATHLGGDMAVTNPSRLMRVGGTVNYPSEKKRAEKGHIVEATQFIEISNDVVSIDRFLNIYQDKNDSIGSFNSPVTSDVTFSNGLDCRITDGRDGYMSKMIYASIIHLTAELKRFPEPQEVFVDCWNVYVRKVSPREGRTLDQDNRGAKMMQQKIVSKLRNFKDGRMNNARSIEEIIRNNRDTEKVSNSTPLATIDLETGEIIEKKIFNINDWVASEVFKGEPPEIQWLVDSLIPSGVPFLLAAAGGLGKSFVTLDMCIKIATPKNVLSNYDIFGHTINETGKAVFITAEDSKDDIHRRINKIVSPEKLEATRRNLIIIPMSETDVSQVLIKDGNNGLEMTDFFHTLKEQLLAHDDLKLVAIDPLQAFCGADITSKPEAAQFMWSAFSKIASQTGAAFLCTHHMRKDGSNAIKTAADAREGIRGTTGLVDGARLAYSMWEVTKEIGRLIAKHIGKDYEPKRFIQGAVVKANNETDNKIMSFYREDNGLLTCHGFINIEEVKKIAKITPIQEFIYRAIVNATVDYGQSITVYPDNPPVMCITYEKFHQQLEKEGYKDFVQKDGEEYDEKKLASKVKNSTTNARVSLRNINKIGFTQQWIWVIQETEEND